MAKFTVEATYHLPIYRQQTYDADTLEEARQLAVEDDDWSDQKEDRDSAARPMSPARGRAMTLPTRSRRLRSHRDSVRRSSVRPSISKPCLASSRVSRIGPTTGPISPIGASARMPRSPRRKQS